MVIGLGSAVLVGIITSVFVYSRLKRADFHSPSGTVTVVVAARYLPAGVVLDTEDLKAVSWPASAALKGMFGQAGACVGRVLAASFAEGQPILEAGLAPKGAGAGLAATIPVGLRAISVPVNDVTAVAGFVLPGTMVDILLTGQVQLNGTEVGLTRTILEDVRVLAVGRSMEQRPESGKPETVSVVTLEVTPEQADKLAMASSEGRIQLALRNRVDSQIISPAPVYRSKLFGVQDDTPLRPLARGNDPAPKRAPSYTVEVIRGNQRTVQSFPEDGKSK